MDIKKLLGKNIEWKTEERYSPVQNNNGQGNNIVNYNMPLPIQVTPYKIKAVIDIIYNHIDIIDKRNIKVVKRSGYKIKNKKTGMSREYFNERVKPHIDLGEQLDDFLKNNNNRKQKRKYNAIVRDINTKFLVHRSKFKTFDEAFENIMTKFEIAFIDKYENDEQAELVEIIFAYMYFSCDIPKAGDGNADKT